MPHEINGHKFIIDLFSDGWAWTNNEGESEAFKTQAEAVGDAIRWVRQKADDEQAVWEERGRFSHDREMARDERRHETKDGEAA